MVCSFETVCMIQINEQKSEHEKSLQDSRFAFFPNETEMWCLHSACGLVDADSPGRHPTGCQD